MENANYAFTQEGLLSFDNIVFIALARWWFYNTRKKITSLISQNILTIITLFSLLLFFYICEEKTLHLEIFSTVATVIGSIIVLVPTLSLISIQKASEAWSPVIIHLYKRDSTLKFFFGFSGVSCIVCFLLSYANEEYKKYFFCIGFFLLYLNICFLFYYIKHICDLLDPRTACNFLVKAAEKEIKKRQKIIARHGSELNTQESVEQAQAEKIFYESSREQIQNLVWYYINGAVEIALKGATRNDNTAAKPAIKSIIKIINFYMSIRKENYNSYAPSFPFLYVATDLDKISQTTCEALQRISRVALQQENEEIIVDVLTAYKDMVLFSIKPLDQPIFFFMSCVQKTFEKKLVDAPFQATELLLGLASEDKIYQHATDDFPEENKTNLSRNYTETPNTVRVYSRIIDSILKIGNYLYKMNKNLSDEAFKRAVLVLDVLFDFLKSSLEDLVTKERKLDPFQIDLFKESFEAAFDKLDLLSPKHPPEYRYNYDLHLIFPKITSCLESLIKLSLFRCANSTTVFVDPLLIDVMQNILKIFSALQQAKKQQTLPYRPLRETLQKIILLLDDLLMELSCRSITERGELYALKDEFSLLIGMPQE